MRIRLPKHPMQLAIETSGRTGSVAILEGPRLVFDQSLDVRKRTAATIGTALQEALEWCEEAKKQLNFLSVADGPGSFTGLRIGVTAAKTLSYALRLPLVSVDSLASIAAAMFANHAMIKSVLVATDAYRDQVFTGDFQVASLLPKVDSIVDTWTAHPASVRILTKDQWAELLAGFQPNDWTLAGDAKPFGSLAELRLPRHHSDAFGVGLLGLRAAIQGHFIDPMSLVPRYLRPSAAEEKMNISKPSG